MFYTNVIIGLLSATVLLVMLFPVEYSDTTGMQLKSSAIYTLSAVLGLDSLCRVMLHNLGLPEARARGCLPTGFAGGVAVGSIHVRRTAGYNAQSLGFVKSVPARAKHAVFEAWYGIDMAKKGAKVQQCPT
jgi:hypothetical protein